MPHGGCLHAPQAKAGLLTKYSESNIRIRMVEPVHFKPDGDNGSYKWQKHDWHYEAEYYRKHEVPIMIQFGV